MSLRNFFSPFSKKKKHRLVGDGSKQGGSGTGVAGVTADLENKGDGSGEKVGSMGLPPQPNNPEAVPEDRKPGLGQNRIDAGKRGVGLMNSSLQSGGEGVPGNRRSWQGNEAVVGREIGPVDPPPQKNLGTSLGDQEPSGGT